MYSFDVDDFCKNSVGTTACQEDYCGPQPLSSAEAKALSSYLRDKKHHLYAYFAIHSFGQQFIYHMSNGSGDQQYLVWPKTTTCLPD